MVFADSPVLLLPFDVQIPFYSLQTFHTLGLRGGRKGGLG